MQTTASPPTTASLAVPTIPKLLPSRLTALSALSAPRTSAWPLAGTTLSTKAPNRKLCSGGTPPTLFNHTPLSNIKLVASTQPPHFNKCRPHFPPLLLTSNGIVVKIQCSLWTVNDWILQRNPKQLVASRYRHLRGLMPLFSCSDPTPVNYL